MNYQPRPQTLRFIATRPQYLLLFLLIYFLVFFGILFFVAVALAVPIAFLLPIIVPAILLFIGLQILLTAASKNKAATLAAIVAVLTATIAVINSGIVLFNAFQTNVAPILAPIWDDFVDLLKTLWGQLVLLVCVRYPPSSNLLADCPFLFEIFDFISANISFLLQLLIGIFEIFTARSEVVAMSNGMPSLQAGDISSVIAWFLEILSIVVLWLFDIIVAFIFFAIDLIVLALSYVSTVVSIWVPAFTITKDATPFLLGTNCSPVILCQVLHGLVDIIAAVFNFLNVVFCYFMVLIIVISQWFDRLICSMFTENITKCFVPYICKVLLGWLIGTCGQIVCPCSHIDPYIQTPVLPFITPNGSQIVDLVPCDIYRYTQVDELLRGSVCLPSLSWADDIIEITLLGFKPVFIALQIITALCNKELGYDPGP